MENKTVKFSNYELFYSKDNDAFVPQARFTLHEGDQIINSHHFNDLSPEKLNKLKQGAAKQPYLTFIVDIIDNMPADHIEKIQNKLTGLSQLTMEELAQSGLYVLNAPSFDTEQPNAKRFIASHTKHQVKAAPEPPIFPVFTLN